MGWIKCPRCEMNYIQEDEKYCKICKREMKGEKPREEVEICTVCNEHPVMPGKDVCAICYKEMSAHETDPESDGTITVDVGIDPVSTMEEIVPDIGDDLSNREYQEMENDLSLQEMAEEEDEDDEEEDE